MIGRVAMTMIVVMVVVRQQQRLDQVDGQHADQHEDPGKRIAMGVPKVAFPFVRVTIILMGMIIFVVMSRVRTVVMPGVLVSDDGRGIFQAELGDRGQQVQEHRTEKDAGRQRERCVQRTISPAQEQRDEAAAQRDRKQCEGFQGQKDG